MTGLRMSTCAVLTLLAIAIGVTATLEGQVGRRQSVFEPNLASEKELLALPHLNAALVKGVMERRPFLSMTELNAFLSQSLSQQQRTDLYGRLFVTVNLNTAS